MSNFKVASVVLSFSVGFLIGQWSTFFAIHPERIRDEAYKMAGISYKYGCLKAKGLKCGVQAYDFEAGLRAQLPIDQIEGLNDE